MNLHRSTKEVKKLDDLIGEKKFLIPTSFANERDPITLKPAIFIGVNGIKTYIVTGEVTPIKYECFCILKDAGILGSNETYEVGGEFDPFV